MGRRIGLLTGTFNPVHLGHLELAKAANAECELDETWFMVNAKEFNSAVESKDGVLDYAHRMEMCKLATLSEETIKVYFGPLAQSPHTIRTFLEMMRRFPEDRFVFIVGLDTIARLDGWDDLDSVVKKSSFAVALRPGVSNDTVSKLRLRLGSLGALLDVHTFAFDRHQSVNATAIRKQAKLNHGPMAITASVHEYITRLRLYQ